jgi:hypothetical protein
MRRFVLGWKMLGLEQSLGSRIVTYADDRVPRTHRCKEVRNCVRDGGRSSGAGRQGQNDEMMALVSLARSYFRNAFQQNLLLADCPRPKRKAANGWPTSAVASSASSHNMATANRLFCRQFLD